MNENNENIIGRLFGACHSMHCAMIVWMRACLFTSRTSCCQRIIFESKTFQIVAIFFAFVCFNCLCMENIYLSIFYSHSSIYNCSLGAKMYVVWVSVSECLIKFCSSCASKRCIDQRKMEKNVREKCCVFPYENSHVATMPLTRILYLSMPFSRTMVTLFRCFCSPLSSHCKNFWSNFVIFTNRVLFAVSFHHHLRRRCSLAKSNSNLLWRKKMKKRTLRQNLMAHGNEWVFSSLFLKSREWARRTREYEVVFLVRVQCVAAVAIVTASGGAATAVLRVWSDNFGRVEQKRPFIRSN